MSRRWIRYVVVIAAGAAIGAVGLGVSAARPDERVQHLTGAYARAHVAKKEAANPRFRELRQQAAARFAEMGVEPTGEILVVRREMLKKSNLVARLLERVVPTTHAATVWVSGGMEVVFESYRSGVNTQWLGWTYNEQLSNGWWVSADTRIDFGPCLTSSSVDPTIMWVAGVQTERDYAPRTGQHASGPVQWLASHLFPTVFAEDVPCNANGRRAVRSFIKAGWQRMRMDNTYNWMASVFAGAAGGPLGFTVGAMSLFSASYATGYLDAMWNFTNRCPGWYWNPW